MVLMIYPLWRYIKVKLKTKFAAVLTVALMLLSSIFASANSSYDHVYTGQDGSGENVGGFGTVIFLLTGPDGTVVKAHCVDTQHAIASGGKYSIEDLDSAGYYTTAKAGKIRSIVNNSLLTKNLAYIQAASGISALTQSQAITASQAAVWHYSNDESYTFADANTTAFYTWLLSLSETNPQTVTVSDIQLEAMQLDNSTVQIIYRALGKNADDSEIALSLTFDKNLAAVYGAAVSAPVKNSNGEYVITVSGLPLGAAFTASAAGQQSLSTEVFFYAPEGGREASQSLVGAKSGLTGVKKTTDVVIKDVAKSCLKVIKKDSVTLKTIKGAVFMASLNPQFATGVKTATTNDSGVATFSGLVRGTWYVKEKTPAPGYIPSTEVLEVSVGENVTIEVEYKNTPYGKIKLYKVNECNAPLEGAVFSLFKGKSTDPANLINDKLTSDENGEILVSDLLPGDYTVLETKPPYGYIGYDKPIYLSVKAGETASFTIKNIDIPRGRGEFYKKDIMTKEQLTGCVITLYSDADLTKAVGTITTLADGPKYIENLLPSTYWAKEISPPEGYLADAPVQEVIIKAGATTVVTFYNSKGYNTAGNYGTLFIICAICIVALGVYYYKKHKK